MTRKSLNYNLNYKQCIMYVKCVAWMDLWTDVLISTMNREDD